MNRPTEAWSWPSFADLSLKARGDQLGGGYPGTAAQRLRVVGNRDGVQVDYAVDGVAGLLQVHPLANGAEVVAEVERIGGRLDAGEDATDTHGQEV